MLLTENLKSLGRKAVRVQVPPWAPIIATKSPDFPKWKIRGFDFLLQLCSTA